MKKLLFVLLLAPLFGHAEPLLSLDANARSHVANDEMVVRLSAEREGPDSAPLTDGVLTALNRAIAEAKSIPGIETRLGNVSTNPSWDSNKKIGWLVHGDLTLTSQDMKSLAGLTGRLSQNLQLAGVSFRLSETKRTQEESRLLKIAATNFREKAAAAASAFGYKSYSLKELTLGQTDYAPPRPVMMMSMAKSSRMAPSVPVEGGDSEVAVTVVGKVELVK